jgi:signal transduction histidine kinase
LRRLFWRIFFSFWLLLVADALVLVVLNPGLIGGPRGMNPALMSAVGQRPPPPDFESGPGGPAGQPFGGAGGPMPPPPGRPGPPPNNGPPGSGPLAQQALQLLSSGGPPAVNGFFHDTQRRTGLRLYLFDSSLRMIAGGVPDDAVRRLAGQALQTGHMQVSSGNGVFAHADSTFDGSGAEYVLVDVASPGQIDYAAAAIRVVIVVAIATIICWWLSRQITLPIVALRIAARDLAAGRFQTRVAPRLGSRRDEIGDLAGDFDTMAGRLEAMVTAQTRLLGDVSHELRSPLARLSVASAIARRNANGHDSAHALDRVDREVERLSELIGQLMLMSKLDVDASSQAGSRIDLASIVKDVCADAAFEAEALGKRIELSTTSEPAVPPGNQELLRSAVENVVRNALRYTGPDTAVEVSLSRRDAFAVIEVRDHGAGVPDSELENIFKPFYRTAEARDRESGGVGLGLAITNRAVARHGGRVTARNAQGGGLIVRIELPV